MFLRNYWYVAATDAEISRKPLGRMILGDPIVLFRAEDGTPVAFEDRCPHRQLPLSMGKLVLHSRMGVALQPVRLNGQRRFDRLFGRAGLLAQADCNDPCFSHLFVRPPRLLHT